MNTDIEWEEWGKRDPYFGVITNPKFRRTGMTHETKIEFFESGTHHVDYVMQVIKQHINSEFRPKQVLDFGCGVGRLLIPFARIAEAAVGLDVSTSMLAEAKKNCDEHGLENISLLQSDDQLSTLSDSFDLIHSFIVFQHIPPERGRAIFAHLLKYLTGGGIAAVHFTYSKMHFVDTHGSAPQWLRARENFPTPPVSVSTRRTDIDPEIQMNPYLMNELFFAMQKAGIKRFHVDFTDHGGELGLFLFFQKPFLSAL